MDKMPKTTRAQGRFFFTPLAITNKTRALAFDSAFDLFPKNNRNAKASLKIATSKIREADRASRAGVSVGNTRQLIEWVNSFLGLIPQRKNEPVSDPKNVGLSKLNDFGNGNTACQILDACTYGEVVKMERVRFGLSLTDSEKLSNWKEFQRSLDKLKISKSIDVNRLAAGLATDNLDLLKYLKALWNSMDNMEDYDPDERRAHAKGSLNSKKAKKKGKAPGGYAAPPANSNERAAIIAARRAKKYTAKQQQQQSDMSSYASDSDYSRDSSVARKKNGKDMEDTVLRKEEERRQKLEAQKKKLLEMKKLQDEARAVKEEKERIKQERIQLKKEEAEKAKSEKARIKEERRIERERRMREKENVESVAASAGGGGDNESLSDITISPRPSPTKQSAKKLKQKQKEKQKKLKKKKAAEDFEEEEELMMTEEDQSTHSKPHNHRWRDNQIPPPQVRQVPAPVPAPAPAPAPDPARAPTPAPAPAPALALALAPALALALAPALAPAQFLSSVQQRFQEKQLELDKLSKPAAPTNTFHPPRLSATNTKLTAMQQLMACHPKIPSDCLMQRELNVVGLQGLMNDLIDSDPQADVSDLVLIFEEENAKLNNKLKSYNDGSNTARVKAVKSYYYGYHGQLMAGNIDKLSRLDVKKDVWMEEKSKTKTQATPKKHATPVKATEKKSKLLQPGWAAKKVAEEEEVQAPPQPNELPNLSPQNNANMMSQMFQMPGFSNTGGQQQQQQQQQPQQFFPPPQYFMAQMRMYQHMMMEQQQKQMAESNGFGGGGGVAMEKKISPAKKMSPRVSPERRPRTPEAKHPVSEKSGRSSHGGRRRQQQGRKEEAEEEFEEFEDDEATQHSKNSRNSRDTRATSRAETRAKATRQGRFTVSPP
ncbi:hypothetical protein TrLO_g6259 [Triparma laevis f. longispina]|uniref:Calponin-homology (CH) domain-containing protein n=1 Tax=Triparma laevis f. longispina TaxID=1714387 RepID=A0A9W7B475_9STRA|nr:hypothetical protein TrLO_g6259 [Triparma laevis f. longispina]